MDGPCNLTREELFMPFIVLRAVDGLEAALSEGNDVAYGLSAGVFTNDEKELDYFLSHAQAGVLYANRASGATTAPGPTPGTRRRSTGA